MYIASNIIEETVSHDVSKMWIEKNLPVAVVAAEVQPVFDDAIIAVPAEVRTPSSSCMICASYDKALGCISQFKCPYLVR